MKIVIALLSGNKSNITFKLFCSGRRSRTCPLMNSNKRPPANYADFCWLVLCVHQRDLRATRGRYWCQIDPGFLTKWNSRHRFQLLINGLRIGKEEQEWKKMWMKRQRKISNFLIDASIFLHSCRLSIDLVFLIVLRFFISPTGLNSTAPYWNNCPNRIEYVQW